MCFFISILLCLMVHFPPITESPKIASIQIGTGQSGGQCTRKITRPCGCVAYSAFFPMAAAASLIKSPFFGLTNVRYACVHSWLASCGSSCRFEGAENSSNNLLSISSAQAIVSYTYSKYPVLSSCLYRGKG